MAGIRIFEVAGRDFRVDACVCLLFLGAPGFGQSPGSTSSVYTPWNILKNMYAGQYAENYMQCTTQDSHTE
jgi:hypothetical protein